MNIDETIKNSIEYEMNKKSKSTSPEVFDRILESVYKETVKDNKRSLSRLKRIHYIAASFVLILSLTLYFAYYCHHNVTSDELTYYKNHNVTSDGLTSHSDMFGGERIYNDNYYITTYKTIDDQKIRNLIGNNVYEIKGVSPLKEIAVFEHGNFEVYKLYVFKKEEAIRMSRRAFFYDSNISLPEKVGVSKNIINVKGKQIPVECELKTKKLGKYKYSITITQKWNSADYNKDNEGGKMLKHYWEYSVDPHYVNPIKEGGSKYPQMELKKNPD